MNTRRVQGALPPKLVFGLFWLVATLFCLVSLDLLDDHYGRISPGRQILMFGELPFRDFLDPGYYLTEFSSAAMQWLFGQSVVGELLLNSLFIATGCVLIAVLARRITGSLVAAIGTGTLALFALPRAYDYDKVLFYPLGIWMAWRWLDQPTPRRVFLLSLTLVIAGLYRYDNGVFLGIAILAGVVVDRWRQPRQLVTRAGAFVLMTALVSLPGLLFIETHGGVGNAIDQAIRYGVRERDRTHLSSLPRIQLGWRLVGMISVPPSQNVVRVRWSPGVRSAEQRQELARGFGLEAEQQDGAAERRTWRYLFPDPSTDRLRRLVNDPLVEDTDGIDRSTLVLQHPESRRLRLQRAWPLMRLRVLPDALTDDNAQSLFYYLLVLLPVIATLLLVRRWSVEQDQRATMVVIIVLAILLDVFILRDPFMARAGGIAGPLALLAAWIMPRVWQVLWHASHRLVRLGCRALTTVAALVLVWTLGTALNWPHQLSDLVAIPGALAPRLSQFARQPPDLGLLPSGRLAGMVQYLRRCTEPADHVFISWFRPELFYFAQRGFGGGMSATFGGHWSEPRFQMRSIAAFEAHPTPLAVLRAGDVGQFRLQYPQLDSYFRRWYRLAGETDFGDTEAGPRAYQVLVRVDRDTTSVDADTSLPCFKP
jgi:hypothetical protein